MKKKLVILATLLLILLAGIFIVDCDTAIDEEAYIHDLSLYEVQQGDTLTLYSQNLTDHSTIMFVEFKDSNGCKTNCFIDKKVRKIEDGVYIMIFDPSRNHGVYLDDSLIICIKGYNDVY